MIRGVASLLLILGLLAMLPGMGGALSAPGEASRLKAEALLDPVLRRADPAGCTGADAGDPAAPAALEALPSSDGARPLSLTPYSTPPLRHRPGPMQARAPPGGDVRA